MIWPPDAQTIINFAVAAGVRGAANRSPGQVMYGGHAAGSYHYLGQAVDFGDADSDCMAAFAAFAPYASGPNAPIVELFGCNGQGFKNGNSVDGAAYDPATVSPSSKHTHVAIARGASLGAYAGQTATLMSTTSPSGFTSRIPVVLRLVEGTIGVLAILAGFIMASKTLRNTLGTVGKGAIAA